MKNQTIFKFSLICLVFTNLLSINGQNLKIKSIPFPLIIKNQPVSCITTDDSILELESAGKTNLFCSPGGNYNVVNAPMVLFTPDSNFTFVAKVQANHREVYDVAALVIYQNDAYWSKFCFENSVDRKPIIVSVVNRKYSDDCNSVYVPTNFAYMAVIKNGLNVSFHYSSDGLHWNMIRNFRLEDSENLQLGFAVHGSKSESFKAYFSDIRYLATTPKDWRNF